MGSRPVRTGVVVLVLAAAAAAVAVLAPRQDRSAPVGAGPAALYGGRVLSAGGRLATGPRFGRAFAGRGRRVHVRVLARPPHRSSPLNIELDTEQGAVRLPAIRPERPRIPVAPAPAVA